MSVYKNGHKQHAIVDDGFPSTLLLLLIVALFINRPKQTPRSRAFKKATVSILSPLLLMALLPVFIVFFLAYALLLKGIQGLYKNKVEISSIHTSSQDNTKENAIHETAPMSAQDIELWEAYHPHQAIPFSGSAAVVRQDPEFSAASSSAQGSVKNTALITRNRSVTHTSDDAVAKLPWSTPPCSSHWVSPIRKDLASDLAIRETPVITIKDTTKDTIKDATTSVTVVPRVASPAALTASVLSSTTLVSSMSSNASTLVNTHTSPGTPELHVLKTGTMKPLPARSLSTVGPSSAASVTFRPSKIGPVGAAAAASGATATPTTTSTDLVTQGTAPPPGGPKIQHAPWSLATTPGQLMTQGFANPGGDQFTTGPSAVVPRFSLDKRSPRLPFSSTQSTKVKFASESGTPSPAFDGSTNGMNSDGTKGSIYNSRATTAISQVPSIRDAKNQVTATKDKNQKINTEDSEKGRELGARSSITKSHKSTFDRLSKRDKSIVDSANETEKEAAIDVSSTTEKETMADGMRKNHYKVGSRSRANMLHESVSPRKTGREEPTELEEPTADETKDNSTCTETTQELEINGQTDATASMNSTKIQQNALTVAAQVARLCLLSIKAIALAIIWSDTEERPQDTAPTTEFPSPSSVNATTSVLNPAPACGPMTSNEHPIHEAYQRHFMNQSPLAPSTVSPRIAITTFPASSSPVITSLAGAQVSPLKPVLPSPVTLSAATSHTETGTTTVSKIKSTVLPGQGCAPPLGGLRSYTANSSSAIASPLSATQGSLFPVGVQHDAGYLAVVPSLSFFQRSDKMEMNPLNNVVNKENAPVKITAKKKSPIENAVNKSGPIEKADTKQDATLNNAAKKKTPIENATKKKAPVENADKKADKKAPIENMAKKKDPVENMYKEKKAPLNNAGKKKAPVENAVKKKDPVKSADKKKAPVENVDKKKKAPIENVAKKTPASTMSATATGAGQAAPAAPARQSFTIPTPPPPTAAQVAMQKARMDAQTAAIVAFWVRQNTFPPVAPLRKKPFIPRGRLPFFRTSKGKMNEDLTEIDEKRSMPTTKMDPARPSKRTNIERPLKDIPMPDARAKRPIWSARTPLCRCHRRNMDPSIKQSRSSTPTTTTSSSSTKTYNHKPTQQNY
ncbi:hypothetical protein BGZ82_006869 [Podila clonocystis]|nr:hypothetical protein BGZ82_006869 [Podila clonocystis]